MSGTNKILGDKGESISANFLIEKGYQIAGRNVRIGRAEIDIIAKINEMIVFVEVKTRTTDYHGYPEDFVDDRKQKMIENAAQDYMEIHKLENELRFDIVSVVMNDQKTRIYHIEDAFWPNA